MLDSIFNFLDHFLPALLQWAAILAIVSLVAYFVIKKAVKAGIKEAYQEMQTSVESGKKKESEGQNG